MIRDMQITLTRPGRKTGRPAAPKPPLTRAEIAARLEDYDAKLAKISRELADAFAAKGLACAPTVGEAKLQEMGRERAREILDGPEAKPALPERLSDALLPRTQRVDKNHPYVEQIALRIAIDTLRRQDEELAWIEEQERAAAARTWAMARRSDWDRRLKTWASAVAAFAAADADCEEFLQASAGGHDVLSFHDLPAGIASIIIGRTSMATVLERAHRAGLISNTELRKAQHAKD